MEIHDDKTFEDISYAGKLIREREFNNCVFKKCDLSESDFIQTEFIDCVFENCNLSMIKLDRSVLNNVLFKHCKVLGVNFSLCEDFLFSIGFESSILDYSSFQRKKMPKTNFIKSSLKEVTFSQANISGSVFTDSDLLGAIFNQTDLSSANLSAAVNYIIYPELNNISKAIFSADGLPGLLMQYNIKIV